ncbi:GLE1-domain-containing protein [Durotheca rogersii]|uniref:GLE1-domain-containing protein n=1 Tax=Durotheca rogersii TaxID=419775 RepID=UPI00221EFD4A|nr:GLE1-domain-containing protein [Durotheca rogersii]KAI5867188.1 GLE1-domain-containing protein [Durotheca rogersii]
MAGSSPTTRKSNQWSSPDRSRSSSLFSGDRNTELSHQDALTAAQVEHERVRAAAIRVYHDHELQEEHRRILAEHQRVIERQRKEEERIRSEERLRAEQERLRALKAKIVPKLPPEPPTPVTEAAGPAVPRMQPQPVSTGRSQTIPSVKPSPFLQQPPASLKGAPGQANGISGGVKPQQPSSSNPFSSFKPVPEGQPSRTPSTFAQAPKTATPRSDGVFVGSIRTGPAITNVDRYIEIHENLKNLRASLVQQSKVSPFLKQRLGDMRRELRKNMGQLVGEKGGNKKQVVTIQTLLNESLSGAVPSEPVDPSLFITDKRDPVDGAVHNEAQLPSLFIYLLNHFAKAVINQFISECGAQPKTADPIGVVTAMVFSNKAYLWRGKSLIDILMAKFRVVCPVLFGYRGSEKTEQGRLRLGWKRTASGWAPEQQHADRMKGLGVGYAAITLRDFSKSPNTNPWPPSKYWACLARIVNTPPAEISNTQCIVLRAMIEIYEERFIHFYGSAAIAALRKALVEFPSKAEIKTPGVSGLQVLAQILKRDLGLEL